MEKLEFQGFTHGIRHAGCDSRLVERSRFVAAVPADSALAERGSITLAELAEHPFILPPQKFAEQSETLDLFKSVGVVPRVEQESSQTNTTLSLVSAGLGCSVVMATAALQRPRNIQFLKITDAPAEAKWELAMAWHPGRLSPQARQFLACIDQHLAASPHLLQADACEEWLGSGSARHE